MGRGNFLLKEKESNTFIVTGRRANIYEYCKYYRTPERCGADNKKPKCCSKCLTFR